MTTPTEPATTPAKAPTTPSEPATTPAEPATTPAAAPPAPPAPLANQWNLFSRRSVGGRGLSKEQVSLAYAAYAAAAQRKAKLGWNEWQRAAGGKGYSKEQISTMYKARRQTRPSDFCYEEGATAAAGAA